MGRLFAREERSTGDASGKAIRVRQWSGETGETVSHQPQRTFTDEDSSARQLLANLSEF